MIGRCVERISRDDFAHQELSRTIRLDTHVEPTTIYHNVSTLALLVLKEPYKKYS